MGTSGLITLIARRPSAGGGVGLGVGVCVVEAVGRERDVAAGHKEYILEGEVAAANGDVIVAAAGRRLGRGVEWPRVAAALAAAGNAHRLKIMAYLLEAPATYRGLQKATGLQVGPLYHHIDKLRLAGLMGPKERDLYTLTRAGRNLVLLAMVVGSLVKDRRPRPQPTS
ncbi:MAG: ArsR family transcriptional regulator [Planctomycetota bacterium]